MSARRNVLLIGGVNKMPISAMFSARRPVLAMIIQHDKTNSLVCSIETFGTYLDVSPIQLSCMFLKEI